ncbi:MAG: hypothetical protein IPL59_11325 [Candidatus Competibacteraceae bacterium]|nr:hypothetical protein [Candidatus Competibacteraceae bacterium]
MKTRRIRQVPLFHFKAGSMINCGLISYLCPVAGGRPTAHNNYGPNSTAKVYSNGGSFLLIAKTNSGFMATGNIRDWLYVGIIDRALTAIIRRGRLAGDLQYQQL